MRMIGILTAAGLSLGVAACTGMSDTQQATLSGGAIGAGLGAGAGALAGNPAAGAAIGGALGAGGGYLSEKLDD